MDTVRAFSILFVVTELKKANINADSLCDDSIIAIVQKVRDILYAGKKDNITTKTVSTTVSNAQPCDSIGDIILKNLEPYIGPRNLCTQYLQANENLQGDTNDPLLIKVRAIDHQEGAVIALKKKQHCLRTTIKQHDAKLREYFIRGKKEIHSIGKFRFDPLLLFKGTLKHEDIPQLVALLNERFSLNLDLYFEKKTYDDGIFIRVTWSTEQDNPACKTGIFHFGRDQE